QPPTKSPKYRRNDYNPVRMQVCALSRGKTLVRNMLILNCLQRRAEEGYSATVPARHEFTRTITALRNLSSLFPESYHQFEQYQTGLGQCLRVRQSHRRTPCLAASTQAATAWVWVAVAPVP